VNSVQVLCCIVIFAFSKEELLCALCAFARDMVFQNLSDDFEDKKNKNRPFFGWRRGGYLLWQPGGHDLLGFRSLALRPWLLPGLLFLLGVCQ
jgi:hypothetical protein